VKAIITAAGQSSRLWETTGREPKTLLPFGNGSILSAILENFGAAGVRDFLVVVGYRGELIAEHLRTHDGFGFAVEILENPEWHRGNGLSAPGAFGSRRTGPPIDVRPPGVRRPLAWTTATNLLLVDFRSEVSI
jgi:NDP-sugar pyrophosphorylase family protein